MSIIRLQPDRGSRAALSKRTSLVWAAAAEAAALSIDPNYYLKLKNVTPYRDNDMRKRSRDETAISYRPS